MFETTFYGTEDESKDQNRVEVGQVQAFNYADRGVKLKTSNMYDDFVKKVNEFKPDIIMASVLEDTFRIFINFMEKIKDKKIPCLAGGQFASSAPEKVIELDFIKSIYVVHNTLFETKFQNWHESYKNKGRVRLINNGISEVSSRRGAVADIAKTVDKQSIYEPVVVFPGDTVFTFNVKKFFYEVKRRPELGWLSLRVEKNEKKRRSYGVVGLNNDGVVTSFNEKPAESTDDYVYKGPCYFPPTVTSKLNSYCSGLKEEGTLPDNIGSFISWSISKSDKC